MGSKGLQTEILEFTPNRAVFSGYEINKINILKIKVKNISNIP